MNFITFKYNSSFYFTVTSLLSKENNCCCILAGNAKNAFDSFFDQHLKIEAAGGIVQNSKQNILFIYRNGIWDLPKGKIEINEDIKIAAIREVEEECGPVNPVITEDTLCTYHTYLHKDELDLKKTHWFFMSYNGSSYYIPLLDERITKVKWMNFEEIEIVKKATFKSIVDVIDACLNRI